MSVVSFRVRDHRRRTMSVVGVRVVIPYVGTTGGSTNYVGAISSSPGQDPTQLTTATAGFVVSPVLSPDRSLIAYIEGQSIWTVKPDGSGDIKILDISGGGETPDSLDWKKDSSGLVYCRKLGVNQHKLYMINKDGTGDTVIYTDGSGRDVSGPSYSHDGQKVAFQVLLSATSIGIFVANADGSGATQIATTPTQLSQIYFNLPIYAWANTQRRFAWNDGTLAAPVWKAINDDGTNTVTIKTFTAAAGRPNWKRWSTNDAFLYHTKQGDLTIIEKSATDGSGTSTVIDDTVSFTSSTVFVFDARIYLRTGDIYSVKEDGTDLRNESTATSDTLSLL